MSEEITHNLSDKRSFEERVLARFDAFDARFDSIDARLEKLESRNHDTKPIWERALKAIMETGLEVGDLKTKVDGIETKVDGIETKVGVIETKVGVIETKVGVIETKVELLQHEMETIKTSIRNELVDMRRALKHNVGDRLDMIHKVLLDN